MGEGERGEELPTRFIEFPFFYLPIFLLSKFFRQL